MDVVVVGGGMGGLTLAALLVRNGVHNVTVLEQAQEYGEIGYGIGLYPLGGAVFNALGQEANLLSRGQVLDIYRMHGPNGKLLQELDLSATLAEFGPVVGISREALLDILAEQVGDRVKFGQRVNSAQQVGDRVLVRTEQGDEFEGDVTIAADGMNSALRTQFFGEIELDKTGFDAWMWWAPEDTGPAGVVSEYWGAKGFVGLYPMPKRVNVAIAIPSELSPSPDLDASGILAQLRKVVGEHCPGGANVPGIWDIVEGKPFLWPLADVRAPDIVALDNRVALLGDSGIGFLPTAGVGASNAIRSAASLAYELSLANAATAPAAIARWRERVHKLVIGNQNASREAGKAMLVRHKSSEALIDLLMKHVPVTAFANSIIKSMKAPF